MALRNRWSRWEEAWDGAGALVALLGFAVLVGLGVGYSAQRWANDPGRLPGRFERHSVSKSAGALGYQTDEAFEADRKRETETVTRLLGMPVGSQLLWENPETGNRGVIWVAGEHAGGSGTEANAICRDLVRHTLLNNSFRNTLGTTCRKPNQAFSADVTWQQDRRD
jgi:surface antigen